MRWVIAIAILAFKLTTTANVFTCAAEEITPQLPNEFAQGYRLTWHDEFNGSTLNKSEWNLRTGERFASMNKAENVNVAAGMLRIALKKEKAGGWTIPAEG